MPGMMRIQGNEYLNYMLINEAYIMLNAIIF